MITDYVNEQMNIDRQGRKQFSDYYFGELD